MTFNQKGVFYIRAVAGRACDKNRNFPAARALLTFLFVSLFAFSFARDLYYSSVRAGANESTAARRFFTFYRSSESRARECIECAGYGVYRWIGNIACFVLNWNCYCADKGE